MVDHAMSDAIDADDEMFDALATARMTDDTEAIFRLLAQWRREADGMPILELVDVDTAVALIETARSQP